MKLVLYVLIIGVSFILLSSISFADSKDKQTSKKEMFGITDIPKTSSLEEVNNNRMIILLNDAVTQQDIDHFRGKNINVVKTFDIIPAIVVEIPPGITGLYQVNNAARENNKMMDIYPDKIMQISLDNSIPQIQATIPFNVGIKGDNIRVCVIDTGVDDTHPNLPTLVAEFDFVNNDADATDDEGHGTHVAGIIASNHATFRGVAPNVDLMAAKVLGSDGFGFISDIISGIDWCVTNNADVINLSLGSGLFPSNCDGELTAIAGNNANDAGVVVIAASGNEFQIANLASPACGSKIVAVGSVTDGDGRTSYANEGSELDIVAPGGDKFPITLESPHFIESTSFGGSGFVSNSGTSMAAPHVAGAAALVLQKFPTYTTQQVKDALYDNSVDLGTAGFDTIFGNGRLNVSFLNSFCTPPGSGTWTITASCTMTASATAPGNVLVQNNSLLTVPSGITLDINFGSFNLTVKSGSGVLVESGGTIT